MRHNREFWQHHVDGWRKSGLTQQEYSDEHGVVKGTLGYWSSKLRAEADVVEESELVEVGRIGINGEGKPEPPPTAIELMVGGRYLLRLWPGTERRHLGDVLAVLEGRR